MCVHINNQYQIAHINSDHDTEEDQSGTVFSLSLAHMLCIYLVHNNRVSKETKTKTTTKRHFAYSNFISQIHS